MCTTLASSHNKVSLIAKVKESYISSIGLREMVLSKNKLVVLPTDWSPWWYTS